jgi:inositol-hexakisphosphate/diphosphoinositol-pentakisphosphate 1-kinase
MARVQGQKSYVCDVNGWSFVKNSRKYYDDCARVLCETILLAIRPEYHSILSTVQPLTRNTQQLLEQPAFLRNDSTDTNRQAFEEEEELLCVISVIRHGDRTPKQKMKLLLTDPRYLDFFHANSSSPFANLKVKSKHALTDFLELTKSIIHEGREKCGNMEYFSKLLRIRDVLESHKISGITRKLQMKPTQWSEPIPASSSSPPSPSPAESATETAGMSSSKVELSPNAIRATEVQFILKWGGDLTPLGEEQAEKMGAEFRSFMYPDPSGGGVLRLHSTFRHDLKIKASDEGRVMKTAAAFTKGLLELEGDLTPVLVSLVTVQEKNNQLLDHYDNLEVKKSVDQCKSYLNTVLQMDREFTPEFVNSIAPNATTFTRESLMKLGNPRKTLSQIHDLIKALCVEINGYVILMNKYTEAETEAKPEALSEAETMNQQSLSDSSASSLTTPLADLPPATAALSPTATVSSPPPPLPELYLNESYDLFLDRWEKLKKDFYNKKTGFYDLTKVPEVYDMARYDVIHQDHRLGNSRHILLELFGIVQLFTDCVVPQEYGVNSSDKMKIGRKMCFALLKKIRYDLNVAKSGTQIDLQYLLDLSHGDDLRIKTLGRSVRTRLYFTSESHIYTLLNVLNSTPTIASSALNSVSATPPPPSPLSAAATTTGTGDGEGTGEGEVSSPPPPSPSPSPLSDVSTTLSPILSAEGKEEIDKLSELSYLSQITIRLFDNRTLSNDDKNKYRCEISFSPGVFNDPTVEGEHRGKITPPFILNKNIPCDDVIAFLIAATDDNRTPEEEAVVGTGKGGEEVNEECCGEGINGDEPSEDLSREK